MKHGHAHMSSLAISSPSEAFSAAVAVRRQLYPPAGPAAAAVRRDWRWYCLRRQ